MTPPVHSAAPTLVDADLAAELLRNGYLILPSLAERERIEAISHDFDASFAAAPFCSGSFYGARTKRFGRLPARSRHAEYFACHPTILKIVESIFATAEVQLNLSQCIEIHPGSLVQPPHRDHDMWACTKPQGTTHLINVMWTLTEFTPENGGTRVWPGTNHDDWSLKLPTDDGVVELSAPEGSAILFLGQTLHAGGANRTERPRRGMVYSYCRDWLLPHENPWLAYPPDIARHFSPTMAALVGYRQRHGGLNNFEGQSPERLLQCDPADYSIFTDMMSDEHMSAIDGYYRARGDA